MLHWNDSAIVTRVDKFQQCVSIKLYVKFSKNVTRNLKTLHQPFGKHSLGQTQVFEWHMHFNASQVLV